ncbi:MAG: VWA domain-containing protein [Pyrinomonadaceae bacterium]|nr:VWA domain-containing protein [Pyrinomonadaceae bacterium]MCX7640183.1 VWA domain-containing protein [Pyrinomonadaceae bacterium]MDW8303229.1 VWA domain-containing protein [Acidobacteriota bacterium]
MIRWIIFTFLLCTSFQAQTFNFDISGNAEEIEIENLHGKIIVFGKEDVKQLSIGVESNKPFYEKEIKILQRKRGLQIVVTPEESQRVDLTIQMPANLIVRAKTKDGEIRFLGYFKFCDARTQTGTISTDIPIDDLEYKFSWLSSYPRFLSAVDVGEIKEKAAGRFVISGRTDKENSKEDKKARRKLDFKTERGIILFNVHPSEVPPDLRERPLTEAAKAIIRSGDGLLMEAIRRVSPKYFGDYAKTLPPRRAEPLLKFQKDASLDNSGVKQIVVRVLDSEGRAVSGLKKDDFMVLEKDQQKEIISAEPVKAPVNLVLLLDVSGSVENYIDFIRRAAKAFIDAMDKKDRIAIVTFNDDVKVLADFTTDREKLYMSLNEFDAGGATAFYDALAYVLVEVLRPFQKERKAIVILSDGDDNRSFLSFSDLIPTIQESGVLIYPLYVPSSLIAFSAQTDLSKTSDPVWTKYMSLTSKAKEEGPMLAKASGGFYYQISQLEQIQKAYDDIALQLKSAYTITFRSDMSPSTDGKNPRLRVRVSRENAYVVIEEVKMGQ